MKRLLRAACYAISTLALLAVLWGPSPAVAKCRTDYTEEFLTLKLFAPPTVDGAPAPGDETLRWAAEGELIQNFLDDALRLVVREDGTVVDLREAE